MTTKTPKTDKALEVARQLSSDDEEFYQAATGLLENLARGLEMESQALSEELLEANCYAERLRAEARGFTSAGQQTEAESK
jgi:hypothetical protein